MSIQHQASVVFIPEVINAGRIVININYGI